MGLIKRIKNSKHPLLGQIIELIPSSIISKAILELNSDYRFKTYKTYDQLVALLFGQLNKCYALRDICIGLKVSGDFLCDIGLKQSPARSTMSYTHAKRSWKVYEYIFMKILAHYKRLFTRTATVWDEKNQKELIILTNNMDWPAHVVAELYKRRGKI